MTIRTLLLSLPLFAPIAAAAAQGPIPSWLRAPAAQANFTANATTWNVANAFLAMSHAVMAGPTDIGFSSWQDTAAQRASYETRIRAILLGTGTATYGSGASAITAAGWGYTAVSFFRSTLTDTEGFIASGPSHTIIAFRGSELSDLGSFLQDWAQTDFNFAPVTLLNNQLLPAGTVHAGFLAAVLSVSDQIVNQLRNVHGYETRFQIVNGQLTAVRNTNPIWTTGYSLGAACATLSAFVLSRQAGMPVRGAITGGAPMVGNAAFGSLWLNSGLQLYRHGNNCEIVPLGFGEVAQLPGDMTGTVERVGNWIAGSFPEPLRTPMQVLAGLMMAPANWVTDGVSTVNGFAAAINANYAHFGELRYWNRNATMSLNPTATTRQNDREITFANDIIDVLAQFLPPAPPSNPFDAFGWAQYFDRLAQLGGAIAAAVANPGAFVASLAGTLQQYVTDHSTVKQARLLFDAMPLNLRTSPSMPGRP